MERIILRVIEQNVEAQIVSIIEQEIPATAAEIGLFLRRAPVREVAANALLAGGAVTIEVKNG